MYLYENNCEGLLANALGEYDTTVTVTNAGRWPSEQFAPSRPMLATLSNRSIPGVFEVVRIVGRDEGAPNPNVAFVVKRAQESSDRFEWPAGTTLSARITAGMLDSFATKITDGYFWPAGLGQTSYFGIADNPAILRNFPTLLDSPTYDWHEAGNSLPVCGASVFVDLGVPRVWSGSNYQHGDVVQPPVANGYQYWASTNASFMYNTEADFSNAGEVVPFITYGGQQRGAWMPMATPLDFSARLGIGAAFVVDEVGFIVLSTNASTVPTVSIGSALDSNSRDKTRFANAVALSQIDPSVGGGQVHRIPVTAGGSLVDELTFRLDAAATGGSFVGRFYWRGFFVETD